MNIALIGYGKMGKAIEEIAVARGHSVVLKITSANLADIQEVNSGNVDVAIEFTLPEVAKSNVMVCLGGGVPVVCGTTGWYDELKDVVSLVEAGNGSFLYASNFSIGVNIFFEINKVLANLMNQQQEYGISIEETHHTHKKDAPSGTAITLAEQVIQRIDRKNTWALNFLNNESILPIIAHRLEDVPGTHSVKYTSEIDEIEIKHTAHNRTGFAFGAVLAAEFLQGKKGMFTMRDVLGLV